MARSRIAVLGASCLLAATLGGAAAQTAGSPLPLLQIDRAKPAAHVHHKATRIATRSADKVVRRHIAKHLAKRVHAKTRVADAGDDLPAPPAASRQAPPPQPPQTTPQGDAQTIWSAPAAVLAGNVAAPSGSAVATAVAPVAPATAPAAKVITEPVVGTDPNGILNGGHDVPAAIPGAVKPAASASTQQPAVAQPSPSAAPPMQTAAAPPSSPMKTAAAAPVPPKPAHAMLVNPSTRGPVGSASWIAQILAALGGAIAAGVVAWFLIRPAPERHYG